MAAGVEECRRTRCRRTGSGTGSPSRACEAGGARRRKLVLAEAAGCVEECLEKNPFPDGRPLGTTRRLPGRQKRVSETR